MRNLSPIELEAWLKDASRERPALIDVREPWEWEICHLDGSKHVPMREIPARLAELEPDRPTILICHHGGRSLQTGYFLEHQGFSQVFNLAGGVNAWARTVDPEMPVY